MGSPLLQWAPLATSAPRLSPHLRRDWAHPLPQAHRLQICAGTGWAHPRQRCSPQSSVRLGTLSPIIRTLIPIIRTLVPIYPYPYSDYPYPGSALRTRACPARSATRRPSTACSTQPERKLRATRRVLGEHTQPSLSARTEYSHRVRTCLTL
jgi:hypothetical protein